MFPVHALQDGGMMFSCRPSSPQLSEWKSICVIHSSHNSLGRCLDIFDVPSARARVCACVRVHVCVYKYTCIFLLKKL